MYIIPSHNESCTDHTILPIITQIIAGNALVTGQPQFSSKFVSQRKTKISANRLIYNNLHRNHCNNFHIPNSLDFLWNSNIQ